MTSHDDTSPPRRDSEETCRKISEARRGVPKTSEDDSELNRDVLFGTWTTAKSWWLGVTFGRGTLDNAVGRRKITINSERQDVVMKWAAITGIDPSSIKLRSDSKCYRLELADIQLSTWLEQSFQIGSATEEMRWPNLLPEVMVPDFVRGLWDSKGYINRTIRKDKCPAFQVGFYTQSPTFLAELSKRFPELHAVSTKAKTGKYADRTYPGVQVLGVAALEFAWSLYQYAPENLRSAELYENLLTFREDYAKATGPCVRCGKPTVYGKQKCRSCALLKWEGVSCSCGNPKVYAKGLCQTCHHREWEHTRNSAKNLAQE